MAPRASPSTASSHDLAANEGATCLHGGPGASTPGAGPWWRRRRLTRAASWSAPTATRASPGRSPRRVRYAVTADTVTIEHRAATDAPTVVSLTNHAYLNLAGRGHRRRPPAHRGRRRLPTRRRPLDSPRAAGTGAGHPVRPPCRWRDRRTGALAPPPGAAGLGRSTTPSSCVVTDCVSQPCWSTRAQGAFWRSRRRSPPYRSTREQARRHAGGPGRSPAGYPGRHRAGVPGIPGRPEPARLPVGRAAPRRGVPRHHRVAVLGWVRPAAVWVWGPPRRPLVPPAPRLESAG